MSRADERERVLEAALREAVAEHEEQAEAWADGEFGDSGQVEYHRERADRLRRALSAGAPPEPVAWMVEKLLGEHRSRLEAIIAACVRNAGECEDLCGYCSECLARACKVSLQRLARALSAPTGAPEVGEHETQERR